jgi:hypothetical protein
MDQFKPQLNIVVKIEENMSCRITLCIEHIVTVKLHNYKCILMHSKETHFYLKTTWDSIEGFTKVTQ